MERFSSMLPSEQMYSAFEEPSTCSVRPNGPGCNERVKRNVHYGLQGKVISDHESLADNIVRNHHYACTSAGKRTDKAAYYDLCHFLYFWIGGSIKGILDEWNDLTGAMRTIYGNLAGDRCNNGCSVLYTDMSKSNFDWRKIIFDYSYNVSTLQSNSTEEKQFLCSSDCKQYVQEVKEAYSKVKDSCNGYNTSNDKWCKEFTEEYRTYFDADQPKLTCKTECEPEPPTMRDLEKLLSGGAYNEFNNNWRTYNGVGSTAALKSSLHNLLRRYLDIPDCTDKVASAWYYMTDVMNKTHNQYYEDRCEYFYYWLGDLVSSKLKINGGTASFSNAMNELYAALQKLPGSKGKCEVIITSKHVDSALFNSRKKIFDFHRHYENIKEMLGRSGNQCNSTFGTFVDRMKSAYTAVEEDIGGGSNEYWNEFWKRHKEVISGKIRNLTCTVSPKKPSAGDDFDLGDAVVDGGNGDHAQNQGKKAEGAQNQGTKTESSSVQSTESSSNIAPGAAAGTLFTVGLPTIAYLIYKYKPQLFSLGGNRNRSFGHGRNGLNRNGRNRGRSTLRSQLNAIPDDHDTSTLGSDSMTDTSNYSLPYTTSSYR